MPQLFKDNFKGEELPTGVSVGDKMFEVWILCDIALYPWITYNIKTTISVVVEDNRITAVGRHTQKKYSRKIVSLLMCGQWCLLVCRLQE